MTPGEEPQRPTNATMLRSPAANQRTAILRVAVTLMALVALPWLAINVEKLLWAHPPWGAVDLEYRYKEVHLWFAGESVYGEYAHAVYPPASYAMLWPFLGWLAFPPARVVWAATTAAALVWLAYLLVQESGAQTRLERRFVVLMLLSMYATGFSIGHGQLTIHVLLALVAGLTCVCRGQRTWQADLVAAALILAALVKPTISVPFVWLVLFIPGRLRPALLVGVGYVALTLVAISFQGFDLVSLHRAWAARSVAGAAHGAITGGYGDQHSWLAALRLEQWNVPASLLTLLALGWWTYRQRHGDMWLLLGVTALVARFWVYHRAYDDMLVVLPMVTLFRLATQGLARHGGDVVAGLLLAVALAVMFAPGLMLVFPPWEPLLKEVQTLVRMVLLIFLVYCSWSAPTSRARACFG